MDRSRALEEQPIETTLYSLASSAPKRPERRSSERYLSLLRIGAILVSGRRELCLIRNISAGGMMIRAYSNIVCGTRLLVELKQSEPVAGVVQWIEDGLTGVAFDQPIDVIALLAPTTGGPRPRLPRIEVSCTAWVREGANIFRTKVSNISQGGICIDALAKLTTGADVVVTLLGMSPIAGVVKWAAEDSSGIGFNHVLALPDLMAWLQSQQQEEQRRSAAG